MDALSAEFITDVGSQVWALSTYHPTTIVYIQILLTPYAEALGPAQDVASVRQWIPLALKGDLVDGALAQIEQAVTISKDNHDGGDHPDALIATKTALIKYLTAEIMGMAGGDARQTNSTIILPWDIQFSLGASADLSEMFNVPYATNTLPVSVTIGPQSFIHMLTVDFTVGLLLFSMMVERDFNITIFGTPFSSDYFIEDDDRNTGYHDNDNATLPSKFSVEINDTKYLFATPDFMRGFATAASWTGVDHYAYWSELTSYFDDSGVEKITKLTF